MINLYKKYKNQILNLSLKKIYSHFFLNDFKKTGYYDHIKNLVFDFLISRYPDYNKESFEKKINFLIGNIDNSVKDQKQYATKNESSYNSLNTGIDSYFEKDAWSMG